jgi:hypothetical protein
MTILADTLITETQDFVKNCTITVAVDGADVNGDPTYSVKLAAPGMAETLLEAQDAAGVSVAVTEFTDWVTAKWAALA